MVLVPFNANIGNNPNELISMEEINLWSKFIKSKHILFIFDCCFSGLSLFRSAKKTHNPEKHFTKCKLYRSMNINLNHKSRIVINAGLSHQSIIDNINGNSALTQTIINSPILNNGIGSVNQLFSYILEKISNEYEQNPCMGYLHGHQGTDIYLSI